VAVAEAGERVAHAAGADVRDAIAVADDLDGAAQSGHRRTTVVRRHGTAVDVPDAREGAGERARSDAARDRRPLSPGRHPSAQPLSLGRNVNGAKRGWMQVS
jgi:hypothetical protein